MATEKIGVVREDMLAITHPRRRESPHLSPSPNPSRRWADCGGPSRPRQAAAKPSESISSITWTWTRSKETCREGHAPLRRRATPVHLRTGADRRRRRASRGCSYAGARHTSRVSRRRTRRARRRRGDRHGHENGGARSGGSRNGGDRSGCDRGRGKCNGGRLRPRNRHVRGSAHNLCLLR